jgi:hypothetical protein
MHMGTSYAPAHNLPAHLLSRRIHVAPACTLWVLPWPAAATSCFYVHSRAAQHMGAHYVKTRHSRCTALPPGCLLPWPQGSLADR